MSVLRVALKDIVPNRYRNIKVYKISEEKIDALIQSYGSTGFWDGSIQAREHPMEPGKFEIAFGHHRIEAAKRYQLEAIGLVVAARSDAEMLRMMADENREEFKHDALVAVETIGTVIEAFGRGEIELPPVDPKTNEKHIHALPGGRAYTLPTIAAFLGWIKPSTGEPTSACRRAFEAYHEPAGAAVARELPTEKRSEVAVQSVVKAARVAREEAKKAGRSDAEQDQLARRAALLQAGSIKKASGVNTRQQAQGVAVTTVHGTPPMPDLKPAAVHTLDKSATNAALVEPFYDEGGITLFNDDCQNVLPSMARNAVIVTDPPYNIGCAYDGYKDRLPTSDYEVLLQGTLSPRPCVAIVFPEAICQLARLLGEDPAEVVAWVYPGRLARSWRAIAWFGCKPDFSRTKTPYRNPKDKRNRDRLSQGHPVTDWWNINIVTHMSGERVDHPCQTPLDVMRRILQTTSAEVVIDPFAGVGTTLVAAKQLGMRAIGIEQSKRYCEIAVQRLRSLTEPAKTSTKRLTKDQHHQQRRLHTKVKPSRSKAATAFRDGANDGE